MFKQLTIITLITFVLAVSLAEIYRFAQIFGLEAYQNVGIVNSVLALIVYLTYRRKSADLSPAEPFQFIWDVGPALLILAGAMLLACGSRLSGGMGTGKWLDGGLLWTILLIPLVEELVFRVGIGLQFRKLVGDGLGGYMSALLFGFIHSNPNIFNIIEGNIGIALGPFFLGIICEYLFYRRKRVTTIVLVHMACNATVPIFSILDPRWLDWLKMLYS